MGRKPTIKVTARVQQRTRVQQRVRVQQTSRTVVGWPGASEPSTEINYYGDSYAISESHQVAIGVTGGVTQISDSARPVDADRLHTVMEQLLDLLDQGQLDVDDPDEVRSDAEDVRDETATDEPDHAQLRAGARRILTGVGTAAAGGTVAQLIGQAILAAIA